MNRFLVLLGVILITALGISVNATPHMISYQGRLTDAAGTPINDTMPLLMSIYTSATGGIAIWDEVHFQVPIQGGLFSVILGSDEPLPDSIFALPELYLSISIHGVNEMTPRTRLISTPYSFRVSSIGGASGGNITGNISVGGNVGIGTTTPTATLDVNGIIKAAGGTSTEWNDALKATNNLSDLTDIELAKTNLGLSPLASVDSIDNTIWSGIPLSIENGGTAANTASGARSNLGLGYLATLDSINNTNWSGVDLGIEHGGTGANNASSARINLGLGPLATLNSINDANWSGADLSIGNGGTGASDASGARINLGLGSLATLSSISDANWSGADLSVGNGGTGVSALTAGYLVKANGSSPFTSSIIFDNGRIGIGTTTPGAMLDIAPTSIPAAAFRNNSATDPTMVLSNASTGVALFVGNQTSGATYPVHIVGFNNAASSKGLWVRGETKIEGSLLQSNGTKNAVVPTSLGMTKVYAQESPEVWFEDFGEGQLIKGHATITLDPLFLETVTISEEYPMQVFLTYYDECNTLIIKRGLVGFEVIESADGQSAATFGYRIVAKRKGYEKDRFEVVDWAKE